MAKPTVFIFSVVALLLASAAQTLGFCSSRLELCARALEKSTVSSTQRYRAGTAKYSLFRPGHGHGDFAHQDSKRPQRRKLQVFAALEVIEPSYNVAIGATVLGTVFGVYDLRAPRPTIYSIPGLLFGLLLLYQTTLHRFVFDDSAFSLARKEQIFAFGDDKLIADPSRRWEINHFANYDFFPSRQFPIVVYVKETQTPSHKWNDGPGKTANSAEALARGARPGAVHFFPAFGDVAQMQAAFDQHKCQKLYHNTD